jgi:UDP-N-acetylmuramyl pentapeptide phosphotransferase/UDP-N-acetylglucosamine-1-phosphate transferase
MVWAVCVAAAVAGAPLVSAALPDSTQRAAAALAYAAGLLLPAGVAVVAVAGMADDLFGSEKDRGLGGHLRAVSEGSVTTGLLKLAVIALMSAWATAPLLVGGTDVLWAARPGVVAWAAGAVLVAGTTNLVNLLDLRPGRALKVSGTLVVLALPALAFSLPPLRGALSPAGWEVAAVVGALALGPMLACLPADLRERSMLGDAGANAAGFVTGLVLAHALSELTLVTAAAAVVALNLMSERLSFSAVIDRSPLLHDLDMIGRRPLPPEPPAHDDADSDDDCWWHE